MAKPVKILIAATLAFVLVSGGCSSGPQTANLDSIGTPGTTAAGPAKATADGTWKVQPGSGVFGGYRIQEIFGGATIKRTVNGQSPVVEGTITIAGTSITAVDVTLDTTKLKSDDDRRDAAIMTKGLETKSFPKATFTLKQPITLPAAPVKDQPMNVTASGDLTLHGVTKPVQVPLTATWTGSTIKVATVGEGLPIQLSDYGIVPISMANFVEIDDHGTLELQLLFVPA